MSYSVNILFYIVNMRHVFRFIISIILRNICTLTIINGVQILWRNQDLSEKSSKSINSGVKVALVDE